MTETVNHPQHYGGADNPYETIKVIEAWELGFNLGNAVKYISRADHKDDALEDLRKAGWYVNRELTMRGGQVEETPTRPDVTYLICGMRGTHGMCVFQSGHQSICRNANGLGIS